MSSLAFVEDGEEFAEGEFEAGAYAGTSLDDRMEQRSEQISKQTTEKFGIPGWPFLAVELRRVGYKKIKAIQKKNERVRNEGTRDIYNIADQVAFATEGLYEIVGEKPDGSPIYRDTGNTWITLAQRLKNCPPNLSTRQSILFLTGGDERIHFLAQEFGEWSAAVGDDDDNEVVEDFSKTG